MLTRFLRYLTERTVSRFDLLCNVSTIILLATETIGIPTFFALCLALGFVSALLEAAAEKTEGVPHGQ